MGCTMWPLLNLVDNHFAVKFGGKGLNMLNFMHLAPGVAHNFPKTVGVQCQI